MADIAAGKKAQKDLEDIEALKRFKPFNEYYQRRLYEEVVKLSEKVLHNDSLDDSQRHDARIEYKTVKRIWDMLDEEESACRRIIDSETQSE